MKNQEHLSGIGLMIQAAFAFSLMAMCVKWAGRNLPSMEIVFFRCLFGLIIILAVMRVKKAPLWGEEKALMTLRGFSGFLALALNFLTIAYLPLGTAMLLNYTGPIFATLLAILFLKERPGPFRIAMILLSFLGVSLLVNTQLNGWNLMVFLGLLSAFFVGIVYVSIRALRHKESPYTIIFYFTAVSLIGSLFLLPFGFKWPGPVDWLLLLAVGACSFFGQMGFTLAIQRAPASLVGPFSYLAPLLSFVYGLFFFGEKLTWVSLLGAFLIILAGCLLTYAEAKSSGTTGEP